MHAVAAEAGNGHRVCFKFVSGNAFDVEIVDYH
jgi:hypothetical protein